MVLLGKALESKSAYKDAIGAYQFGLSKSSEFPPALAALATVLANCPDVGLRNPAQAVQLAEQAVRLTNARDPEPLQALALAFEASGRTADAKAVRAEIDKLKARE